LLKKKGCAIVGNITTTLTIAPIINTIFDISKNKCTSTSSARCDIFKKVKIEGFEHCSRAVKFGFAPSLYVEVPEIGDNGVISQTQFTKCYGLSSEVPNLKYVKIPRDITSEEVNKVFGPIVNRNGCSYVQTKDPNFIKKVKTLWMVVHQKPYLLTSSLISLGMARGLAYEKIHGKPMNWALHAEWTNQKQQ
jgi:hypothetical protein